MPEFRFSPRPNRAAEINWNEWDAPAFDQAREEDKLILLSISAVWCHWCHVMDEESYSDPQLIEAINKNFIPIRVDTDRRPDVNQRYNLGGWPTTAILTPDGHLLTGGTYLTPTRLLNLLTEVSELYRRSKAELKPKAARSIRTEKQLKTEEPEHLADTLLPKLEESILKAYDRQWGGFGISPKFPMVEALLYAIDAYHRTDENHWEELFTHSLEKMASRGMYDQVEGGFFRYSTDREWKIPHYEKMLEDNSLLIQAYLLAGQVSGKSWFLNIAQDVLAYVRNNLFIAEEHAWAGSQDADEEYYASNREQRQQAAAPFVDKTIYTDWNAMMAESLILMGTLTASSRTTDTGIRTLEGLWRRAWKPECGLAHYYANGKAKLYRQLVDTVAFGRAANRAYQATGDYRWLKRSQVLADFALFHLERPEGGFYDIIPSDAAQGALAQPHLDLNSNARTALWLLELAALASSDRYRQSARRALAIWEEDYVLAYGPLAGGFASALLAAQKPWTVITVVGDKQDEQARNMVKECLRQYLPFRVVRWLDPAIKTQTEPWLSTEPPHATTAFVCTGETCLPPTDSIEQLLKYQSEGFLASK